MAAKLKSVEPLVENLQDTSQRVSRLVHADVAAALGAKPVGVRVNSNADPITLATVGAALLRRMRLRGRQPASTCEAKHAKISVEIKDAELLAQIAEAIRANHGFKPSVGQVASVILNLNLAALVRSTRALKNKNATELRRIADSITKESP